LKSTSRAANSRGFRLAIGSSDIDAHMISRLRDRKDAGQRLAASLKSYAGRDDLLVLGIPRGGVPVAFEIATALSAPLDVFIVRKLGLPGHEELAMGAIGSGGARVINEGVVNYYNVSTGELDRVAGAESREMARREKAYRGGLSPVDARGKIAILVDDGLATGATMLTAVKALRSLHPARIIVACGVATPAACAVILREADECVCAIQPHDLSAVSQWYQRFDQTDDDEVKALLAAAPSPASTRAGDALIRN
jgi:predicted phosphoribosyltransferase